MTKKLVAYLLAAVPFVTVAVADDESTEDTQEVVEEVLEEAFKGAMMNQPGFTGG